MIVLNSIRKKYGTKSVLNGISLELNPGQVVGIVGANGAGKTTLFNCIAGIEQYSGMISTPWSDPHKHIAFLPTDPFILSKITGYEYLKFIQLAQNSTIDIKKQNVFNLPLKQYASQYSTGMKKKLAFTGLLLSKHDLIILDEPFNGVDIQSNMVIDEIIKKWKNASKTVLISSHIFSSLKQCCDHIHHLDQGLIKRSADKNKFNAVESDMRQSSLQAELNNLTIL